MVEGGPSPAEPCNEGGGSGMKTCHHAVWASNHMVGGLWLLSTTRAQRRGLLPTLEHHQCDWYMTRNKLGSPSSEK